MRAKRGDFSDKVIEGLSGTAGLAGLRLVRAGLAGVRLEVDTFLDALEKRYQALASNGDDLVTMEDIANLPARGPKNRRKGRSARAQSLRDTIIRFATANGGRFTLDEFREGPGREFDPGYLRRNFYATLNNGTKRGWLRRKGVGSYEIPATPKHKA